MYGACLPPFLQARYRQDLIFRQWVDFCYAHGIPYEHFLGGKDRWTEYSRDIVTMRAMEDLERCSQCGTREEEWNPKQGGDIHAYYPRTTLCLGCKAIEGMHHANYETAKEGVGNTHGQKVRLVPKHVVEREIAKRGLTR